MRTTTQAVELARKGHSVTLLDTSQSNLNIAKSFATESGVTINAIVRADSQTVQLHADKGDSEAVFAASSYDLVLCQEPMYHLLEESGRFNVFCTCTALLRPGGFLLVAFVTQYAHLRDLAQRDPARLATEYDGFYGDYLLSAKYTRNPSSAMHHTHVSEIKELFRIVDGLWAAQHAVAITLNRIGTCEGFLGGRLFSKLVNLPQKDYELWMDFVMQFTDDEALLENADHLRAVAEKKQ